MNRVLKDWHVAGCAVAVVEKNKLIYSRFWTRDYAKIPVRTILICHCPAQKHHAFC